MIKVTDYLVKRLVEYGVNDVFMISGGGAMHLNDSIGRSKDINYFCNHHEQASAISAEGYARTSGRLAVVIVTSGPGGTNTLTGLIGQWLDSVPVLYISGQIKHETSIESCPELGLRQLGDQEINIIDIVKPVTKFAAMIKDTKNIKKYLEKAIYLATSGRPGPVWLDIPMNIQGAMIDEKSLSCYDSSKDRIKFNKDNVNNKIAQSFIELKKSKRPVFIAGHGIRIGKAEKILSEVIEKLKIPVLTTFNGFDLISSDHPLFIGRIGTIGSRAGNFALQNSDLIISVGSRNNIRQVSYNWKGYGREAKKIFIDIDEAELNKPTVKPDIAIVCDSKHFLEELYSLVKDENLPDFTWWVDWCLKRKIKYPVFIDEFKEPDKPVNPYYFISRLTEIMDQDELLVAGNGTACVVLFQVGKVKKGQRIFWNSGCASMGYALPAAIGASIASSTKKVICLTGEGSLAMNIQEFQTLVHYKIPVKIFVLNNKGYISIKQTQEAYFGGNLVGCNEESGVSFPDIIKLSSAYGINSDIIDRHSNMEKKIKHILSEKGPLVCDVRLRDDYKFIPKLSSEKKLDGRIISKPLEDMYPFLPREEFKSNMLIKEIEN